MSEQIVTESLSTKNKVSPDLQFFDDLMLLDSIEDPELYRVAATRFNQIYGESLSTVKQ